MKKLVFILLAVLLVSCSTFAQEILYRDSATLQWDAITTDANGDPLLPEDTVEYEVYIYDSALTIDDQNVANLIAIGTTSLTEQLITFPSRRNWYAGVRAKLTDGSGYVTYSEIAWSYEEVPTVAVGPFVYQPLASVPEKPQGLRDSEM
jgi:hypothetical protein